MDRKIIETINKGLHDEMEAAFNYIHIASQYGDIETKRQFLNYAIEEIGHAQKLLAMLDILEENPGKITIELQEHDDLYVALVEYLSKEESAVFYYDILNKLHHNEEVQLLCKQIQHEEKRHLNHIQDILNKLKLGELKNE